jgi:hypothetical protein
MIPEPITARQPEISGELRAAPTQGDTGTAMTVIMHQLPVAERLGPDDEARCTIGSKAGNGPDDPAFVDPDRRKRRAIRRPQRSRPHRGAAGKQRG